MARRMVRPPTPESKIPTGLLSWVCGREPAGIIVLARPTGLERDSCVSGLANCALLRTGYSRNSRTPQVVAAMQTQQLINPARTVVLAALPPLSLYVHIPWCVRKCPYCDFNSHELKTPPARPLAVSAESGLAIGPELESQYVSALIADLELALPQVWGRPVHTVFLGGGTPSLLSPRALDQLLSAIRARLPVAPDAEITLEANPGTFEAQKFNDFRAAGINRLSIGIQSFDPAHLRALGRIHDATQARTAIEIAQASFDNFNLDLMYALPGQSVE